MRGLKIAGFTIAAIVIVGLLMSAKDIARYIRISSM
jgi:hypothetical protein